MKQHLMKRNPKKRNPKMNKYRYLNHIVLLILVFLQLSCNSKMEITKYAYTTLKIPKSMHKRKPGYLNKIQCYQGNEIFCLYSYTVGYNFASGSFLICTKNREKILIKNNTDTISNLTTFRNFSKSVNIPDSVKKIFEKNIILMVKSNPNGI